MTTGIRPWVARSMQRVSFSPTTEPMVAAMKLKSMTAIMTGWSSILPEPVSTASFSPVFFW